MVASPHEREGVDARPRSTPHVPGLDGLRAWAVFVVVAFHYRFWHAQGGYLGVDIFFVLSGFLITRMLVVEEARTGGMDLTEFARRRLGRLLPALLLLLGTLAIVVLIDGDDRTNETGQLVSALFYVNNWFAMWSDQPAPLTEHLWSLSVEGQFYFTWPLVLRWLMIRRRASPSTLLAVCAVGAVGALGVRLAMYAAGASWTEIYLNSFGRAGGLLIGAGVAFLVTGTLLPGIRRLAATTWAQTGLAIGLLGTVFFALSQGSTAPKWVLLSIVTGLTGCLVLSLVEAPEALPSRLLSGRVQRWTAQRSYAIYLWHLPLRSLPLGALGGVAGATWIVPLAATLVISEASYRYVERPGRRFVIERVLGPMRAA